MYKKQVNQIQNETENIRVYCVVLGLKFKTKESENDHCDNHKEYGSKKFPQSCASVLKKSLIQYPK